MKLAHLAGHVPGNVTLPLASLPPSRGQQGRRHEVEGVEDFPTCREDGCSPETEPRDPSGDLTHCGDPQPIGALIPSVLRGITTNPGIEAPATTETLPRAARQRAPSRRPTWTARQRVAQGLDARGEPTDAICAACPTASGKPLPRSTLKDWRAMRGWADAVRAEQAGIVTVTDDRSRALRLAALEVLGRAMTGELACDANEQAQAAGKILAHTSPPGEAARRSAAKDARAEWLAAIAPEAPEVRARIMARVEGSLDDLPTEELEALTAKGKR